jgi:hypothetical protein
MKPNNAKQTDGLLRSKFVIGTYNLKHNVNLCERNETCYKNH